MKSKTGVANSHSLISTSLPGQNAFLPGVWKLFCDGQKSGWSMFNAEKQKYFKKKIVTHKWVKFMERSSPNVVEKLYIDFLYMKSV